MAIEVGAENLANVCEIGAGRRFIERNSDRALAEFSQVHFAFAGALEHFICALVPQFNAQSVEKIVMSNREPNIFQGHA